jgi:hypothetical protein
VLQLYHSSDSGALRCHRVQIDLRFACPEEGNLQVVVAPVLRFADVGYNAGELVTLLPVMQVSLLLCCCC